jgi:arginyl-tRNA synthetase
MTTAESISTTIENAIRDAIETNYDLKFEDVIKLDAPPNKEMGDFAFACFPLAKLLRQGPPQIAQKLAATIKPKGLLKEVKVVGPYLNFFVDYASFFENICSEILTHPENVGQSDIGQGEKILIEYSAPNTNKPLHLGHIRNNLLGMTVGNLLKACGYDVVLVNLVNDRGIHICKSMLAYQQFGDDQTPESTGVKGDHFVGSFYVRYDQAGKQEREEWLKNYPGDPAKMDKRELDREFLRHSKIYRQAQKMLQQWEAGDPAIRSLWEKMNSWVYEGFNQTYERLGCTFDKFYYESETYKLGKELILEGFEKGVFYQKEDGSVWVDLTDENLNHKLLLRRDGTAVYMTQDIGTTKLKFDDYQMQRAIWVVADEQNYHFQVLFAALKRLGYAWADNCYHLSYGMIDLPEGKMKSREGTVVDADDLMNELFNMEKQEIMTRNIPIAEEDLDKTAEILAQGALKFFILKFTPQTRMIFNPQESISPLGFTGPYIQYAYVRVLSIFRKAQGINFDSLDVAGCDFSVLGNDDEKAIVRKLHDFEQEVQFAAQAYNPARLCTYLFELAKSLNTFYHNHSVLKAESTELMQARLVLSKAVALVLKAGLKLLAIEVPERM